MEFNRIGVANTDIYCLALELNSPRFFIRKPLTTAGISGYNLLIGKIGGIEMEHTTRIELENLKALHYENYP